MAGTVSGGKKAAAKNIAKNPNFYKEIGRKGGRNGNTGGFAHTSVGIDGLTGPERAKIAGGKGGTISRRNAAIAKQPKTPLHLAINDQDDVPQTVLVRTTSKRKFFAGIRRIFS